MNQTQALRKAIKLFGKTAGVQAYPSPSSRELRAAASSEHKALKEKCTTPELRKQYRKELEDAGSRAMYYRYCVGRVEMGMFFAVKACGDSWEGCFRALEQEHQGTAYEREAA
jgi:hypothetical protein